MYWKKNAREMNVKNENLYKFDHSTW